MSRTTFSQSASEARGSQAPPRKGSASKRSLNAAAYLLILPFFLTFGGMVVVPLIYAGYLSLFTTKLIGGSSFSGFSNYVAAFGDSKFLTGLARVALFAIIQVPIMLALALLFALALDSRRVGGAKALRLLIFLPYAIPGVIAALLWGYLLGHDFGPVSQLMRALGLTAPNLLSPGDILGSIIVIVTWEFVGYNMLIIHAALQTIPVPILEAARIDGANQVRIAWSIKLPAVRPAILLALIFNIIGAFQLFNEPNLLQRLAPNSVSDSFTPNLYAYNVAFVNQDIDYAAALSFILGLVIVIISYLVALTLRKRQASA